MTREKTTEEFAIELMKFIAKNNWTESIFMYSNPSTHVEIIGLLNKIAELRGIDKEENGRQYNEIADKLEEEE